MSEFPDIEEVEDMLELISEDIPKEFFNKLNKGIVLLPEVKIHPESERDDLLILGEYSRSFTGRNIKIYYGSFKRVYMGLESEKVYEKLKDTLLHEFTHHLESLAGERGLEVKDAIKLNKYRSKKDI